jgi:hypothetical protein
MYVYVIFIAPKPQAPSGLDIEQGMWPMFPPRLAEDPLLGLPGRDFRRFFFFGQEERDVLFWIN